MNKHDSKDYELEMQDELEEIERRYKKALGFCVNGFIIVLSIYALMFFLDIEPYYQP
ncbi:hypothetical protein N9R79_03725 [Vibrio sp.]|nr:hypothetical protein [Vibrio sp.]